MNTRDIIDDMGGPTRVAELLGISVSAVSQWEKIPLQRALEIQIKTKGRHQIRDMRPDLFRESQDVA